MIVNMTKTFIMPAISLLLCVQACSDLSENASTAIKVEVVENDGKFELLRGGEPYEVRGAGIDNGDLATLVKNGGNSFRTWRVDHSGQTGQELLDEADRLGLTVSLNLVLGVEHWGFDYDDEVAVAAQFEKAKEQILKYRDHPALLTWIIGNELNYDYKNPRVFDAINEIAKMIKQLDPNHPTTTTLAGYDLRAIDAIEQRAADIDFISFQMYGSLVVLPEFIKESEFTKPFFVTEWGAIGHWEVEKTSWGAPIEATSSEKANNYLQGYTKTLDAVSDQLLGSYVFLWGQKQERTPTWYSMFLESGKSTETVDVMHYVWSGDWPENRAPIVEAMLLNGKDAHGNIRLAADQDVVAQFSVRDLDGDKIGYRWELMYESSAVEAGGAREVIPSVISGLIENADTAEISLKTPSNVGAYRLFAYAYDDSGHVAHANIPFYISD